MRDVGELNAHRPARDEKEEEGDGDDGTKTPLWEPSGSWWRDFLYFSGPGAQPRFSSRISVSVASFFFSFHLTTISWTW